MRGLEKPVHSPKTGRPEGLPRTAAITRICLQKKAPQYAMGCGQCSPGFPDLIADLAATHKAYPLRFRRNNRQNLSETPSKITPSVGAAEGSGRVRTIF
ncbi:hypothetical protein [Pseudomonas sp. GM18]|uniref:hypothetical protein n=1 Tax=Pseudomonas sp. GM18 TaxID=1144324 RepID=UPI0012FC203C|nr:hypothetical protein [Pseudomonas sp. GM18]